MTSWLRGFLGVGLIVGVLLGGCRFDYSNLFVSDGDFLNTGRTASFFQAIQVDPRSEDSAGPQTVAAGDLNNDGLVDLVTGWKESQPIQIHLQRAADDGERTFETTTLAGTIPISELADLRVTDFDLDGWADLAVMIKIRDLPDVQEDGPSPMDGAIVIYFNPAGGGDIQNPLAWTEVVLGQSELAGVFGGTRLADDAFGYVNMEIADVDLDGDPDIVATFNWDVANDASPSATDEEAARGNGRVELFLNPDANGANRARRGGEWTRYKSPVTNLHSLEARPVPVKGLALVDIDRDNDLDVVVTYPEADSRNVRWIRNPVIRSENDANEWQVGTVGHVFTGADALTGGDLDRDGIADVLVLSSEGKVIQWFKGPRTPVVETTRNLPWQVYTLAEFIDRTPESMSVADLDGDGQLELLASAQGGIAWFDGLAGASVYDQWVENLIIDDRPGEDPDVPQTTDPGVEPEVVAGSTIINTLLAVDLDGDGALDFVATLDRSGLSGLSNDALVWFQNTR